MKVLVIFPLIFCFLLIFASSGVQAAASKEKSEKCWKDKTKPIDAKGNYQDCNTKAALADNRPNCCLVGSEWGCCKDDNAGRMLHIGLGIGGVALFLGILVFIYSWCDKETFPCLQKAETRIKSKWAFAKNFKLPSKKSASAVRYENQDDEKDDYRSNVTFAAPPEFRQAKQQDEWF